MSNIFKIYINNYNKNENILTHLYLFIKNKYFIDNTLKSVDYLNDLFSNSNSFINSEIYSKYFKDDFSDLDKIYIEKYNPLIKFIDENIYYDDTVETLKLKFIKNYNLLNISNKICFEEVYLFGLVNKEYNSTEIYNLLSNFGKKNIKKQELFDYFNNVNEKEVIMKFFKNKENYDFDDINNLILKEINIQKPIGHSINNNINYVSNPFNLKDYSNYLKSNITGTIEINNNNLLIENNILDNTIYLCLLDDVINYNKNIVLDENYNCIKFYFPLLVNLDIYNYDDFQNKKNELLKNLNNFIEKDDYKNKNNFIDLMYNVYHNSNPLEQKYNGIYSINFNMYSNINVNLPIESLFKLFNSTKIIPFIKLNPGKKMENIYRLYCNRTSTNNKKIPLLKKENIVNYAKNIGKFNTISFVINDNNYDKFKKIKDFFIEINSNGIINVKLNLLSSMSINEIEEFINKYLNIEILENIKTIDLNSFYNIHNFSKLSSTNIEILNIEYNIYYKLDKKIEDIDKIKKCINYIFDTSFYNEKNTKKSINKLNNKIFLFKRVSCYNNSNLIESFIINCIKQDIKPPEIINLLNKDFNIDSLDECTKLFNDLIEKLSFTQNMFNSKKLNIKNNTGINVNFENLNSNNIDIKITNINDVNNIMFIDLYIESIFKILYFMKNSDDQIFKKNIDLSICNPSNIKKNLSSNEIIFLKDKDAKNISNLSNKNIINKNLDLDNIQDYDDISEILSVKLDNEDDDNDNDDNLLNILLNDDDEIDEDIKNESIDKTSMSSINSKSFNDELIIDEDILNKDEVEGEDEEEIEYEIDEEDNSLLDLVDIVDEEKIPENIDETINESIDEKIEEKKDIKIKNQKTKKTEKKLKHPDNKDNIDSDNIDMKHYYINKLRKYQPQLFDNKEILPNSSKTSNVVSKNNGNYITYSRLCQLHRQPIILTEEELNNLKLHNKDVYDNKTLLEYSLDDDKKYYYICPKFWDTKKNIPLTKEEVDSGNYGSVYNEIKNPNGNILVKKTNTKREYPNFLLNTINNDSMEDVCLPCCFTPKKDEEGLYEERKQTCLKSLKKRKKKVSNKFDNSSSSNSDYSSDSDNSINESNDSSISDDSENYDKLDELNVSDDSSKSKSLSKSQKKEKLKKFKFIKSSSKNILNSNKKIYISKHDRTILSQDKVGELPVVISRFLQFNSTKCKITGESNLKPNYSCLLRYGVESSLDQSFLACISDAFCKHQNMKNTYSINEFKKILTKSINIDDFIKCNNGNLSNIFFSKNIDDTYLNNFEINENYINSEFYKILNKDDINQINLYKKIIISYKNFKNYINSKSGVIDYTYLWDIISRPNELLFKNGINLLILDITDEDITENVKVICPKQNFSNEYIDYNKDNLILIKNENYYEPIYIIKDSPLNRITPLISFKIDNNELHLLEFKKVINIIRDYINKDCITKNEKYNFEFERNIDANTIYTILRKLDYNINYQIINYENKVIGLFIENNIENEKNNNFFIPTYPSSILNDETIDIKFIDDSTNIYNNYSNTKSFLNKIYNETNERIKVKPKYKIVKEELIVGILTNGDQMVIVDPPEMYIDDELEIFTENNHLLNDVDVKIQTSFVEDIERIEMINSLKLENSFYTGFRSIIRKLIIHPKYSKNKRNIIKLVKDYSLLYFDKLREIINELQEIGENNVIFAEFDKKIIQNLKNISKFMKECNDSFCVYDNKKEIPNILIPNKNLITNEDNKEIYYFKIADEFIRYNVSQIYLFDHNKNYNNNNIKYEINKNEIVILQSLINKYLFNKKILIKNDYIGFNNYDTFSKDFNEFLEPIVTKDYNILNNKLTNIAQPKKSKIKISKLQLDTIKELSKKQKDKEDLNKHDIEEEEEEEEEQEEDQEEEEDLESKKTKSINIQNSLNYYEDKSNIDNCLISKSKPFNINQKSISDYFNKTIYETFYTFNNKNNLKCSYQLIVSLIKYYYDNINKLKIYENLDIKTLKNDLIELYKNHEYNIALIINRYKYDRIEIKPYINLLKSLYKNKHESSNKNKIENIIENIINDENYYLSYIDIYLLANKYDIPIIFINSSVINIESIKSKDSIDKHLVGHVNNNSNNNYFFIKIPSTNYREKIKYHKLIHTSDNIMINIQNDLSNTKKNIVIDSIDNFKDYILNDVIKTDKLLNK